MKRVGNLYEKIIAFDNLVYSTQRAAKGGKKYRYSIAGFIMNQEKELLQLQRELRNKTYQPLPYQEFTIYDPKRRIISVAHFRDRVVYHALCCHIGPILDRCLIFDSYACRKNKGLHRTLKRVHAFVKQNRYFLKLDIRKYFGSIPHDRLKERLEQKIKDQDAFWLIDRIIGHVPERYTPGNGLPIGNLTSQHFANYYLSSLDHYIKQTLKIKAYLRYMDDFILLSRDKLTLWDACQEIVLYLQDHLGLQINEKATLLGPVSQGVPFLGFKLYPDKIFLLKRNWRRFKRRFIKRQNAYLEGSISEEDLIASVGSMSDFIEYGNTYALRKKFIEKFAIEI